MVVWWLVFVLAVPVYFLWVAIHEFSHLLVIHRTAGVLEWKAKLYPHVGKSGFRFGAVTHTTKRDIKPDDQVWISFAPRIPNYIAGTFLVLYVGCFENPYVNTAWLVVWGAGLVDLAVGLIGYSSLSDLRREASASDISPWLLRILRFCFLIAVAFSTICILLVESVQDSGIGCDRI